MVTLLLGHSALLPPIALLLLALPHFLAVLLDFVLERGVLLREPLDLPVELIELAIELVEVELLLLAHLVHLDAHGLVDLLHLVHFQLQVIALALRLVLLADRLVLFVFQLLELALCFRELLQNVDLVKLLGLDIYELVIARGDQLLLSLILPIQLLHLFFDLLDHQVLLRELVDLIVLQVLHLIFDCLLVSSELLHILLEELDL